jgi:hypothetical protein
LDGLPGEILAFRADAFVRNDDALVLGHLGSSVVEVRGPRPLLPGPPTVVHAARAAHDRGSFAATC